MILLRCTGFGEIVARLAADLETASGDRVCFLVDERHGPVAMPGQLKIGLSVPAIRRLGLYAPPDFAWRCGDYGFYLARQRFADETCFWMIEHDVRIVGDAAQFFDLAGTRPDVDFLVAELRPAEPEWGWAGAVTARDARPYRCLFPVTRLSARAIDVLLTRRQRHSAQLRRRLFWPNDESFVATATHAAGMAAADLHALDPALYDTSTFSYRGVIDEATLPCGSGRPVLYHPVLSGVALETKLARLREEERGSPLIRQIASRIAARVNRVLPW